MNAAERATSRTPQLGRAIRVSELMVRGVVAAHEDARHDDIMRSLRDNHISTVPVINDQRVVVGVLSEADLLDRAAASELSYRGRRWFGGKWRTVPPSQRQTAREIMSSPAVTVSAETELREATRLALNANVHCLPVVDHGGHLIGIVGQADLLRAYYEVGKESPVNGGM
jgi:CBS-domain-containing membrane protein